METLDLGKVAEEQKKAVSAKKKDRERQEALRKGRVARTKRTIKLALFLVVASLIYWFSSVYQLRSPILLSFQIPWFEREVASSGINTIASAQVVQTPKTDKEIMAQYELNLALNGVYMLESTMGKNDSCKEKGLFNGYGYRQNSSENKCYESFEKVTEKVNEWLEERLAYNNNNLAEALCYYNTGIAGQDSCKYSENFLIVLAQIM